MPNADPIQWWIYEALGGEGRADNNCTNKLCSPWTSRHLVLDKCWCHVTSPKDECFSNFTATSVECHYNATQFIMILHTALWWQWQHLNQTLDSRKTPHTSPSGASYGGVYCGILEDLDRIITHVIVCLIKTHRLMRRLPRSYHCLQLIFPWTKCTGEALTTVTAVTVPELRR